MLVRLELWELVIFNKTSWSATNLCLRYASAKCAGYSPIRGIVFCNLGTSKTIISKIVTTVNIVTPYSSRVIWPPQQRSRGTKKRLSRKKSQGQKSIIHKCINSFLAHKLSHNRWLCFFFGRLQVPTRCYIWWCLRTGGGGVLTREHYFLLLTLQLMPRLPLCWTDLSDT